MFKTGNLVKLLNPNKKYYLHFKVDHLIKLDNKFLDAEVIFIERNGTKYILNRNQKLIRDLKGYGIEVITDKLALIYFYKKMDIKTELGTIEFDKNQIGKIMKFNISTSKTSSKVFVVQDFGFRGYYPMISSKNWNILEIYNTKENTIYIENLYDKLDCELYENEGEKFLIYIFNTEYMLSDEYTLTKPIYFDNLSTLKNNNNFALIQPNLNGSLTRSKSFLNLS